MATNQRGGAGKTGGRGAATGASSTSSAAVRRAMMPDEDVQTRFLRELAQRLPLDRVVEAHVFPPMRQGGSETGVAVIAVRREEEVSGEPVAAGEDDASWPGVPGARVAGGDAGTPSDERRASSGASAGEAGGAPPHGEVANDARTEQHQADAAESLSSHDEPASEQSVAGQSVEARVRKAQATEAEPGVVEQRDAETNESRSGGADSDATPGPRSPVPPTPPASRRPRPGPSARHTVFSARYRLTLKGPDRGRWEVAVVEEADAPLVSVDLVVRGVQRRVGEGADPERFTAEQLRALVEAPAAP